MGKKDPRVDEYIAKSADFARPILTELRDRVHAACPGVEETMKWSVPHFDYKGMMASMAAFRQHCAFGFWKASLVMGGAAKGDDAMGHLGRITRVSDLPPKKVFRDYVRKAMALNDAGVKVEKAAKAPKGAVNVPGYVTAALGRNKKALAAFEAFSPSHRREYVQWITEARTDATRTRRLEQAIEWIAEGKPRNWKYMK